MTEPRPEVSRLILVGQDCGALPVDDDVVPHCALVLPEACLDLLDGFQGYASRDVVLDKSLTWSNHTRFSAFLERLARIENLRVAVNGGDLKQDWHEPLLQHYFDGRLFISPVERITAKKLLEKAPMRGLTNVGFLRRVVFEKVRDGGLVYLHDCGLELEAAEEYSPEGTSYLAAALRKRNIFACSNYASSKPALRAFYGRSALSSLSYQPLISVIIPVYKVEDFILETVDSLARQTIKDFEVIFVDDGSPDRAIELLESVVIEGASFVFHRQENQGVSAARNVGLELARGRYIAFLDADDLFTEDALERRLGILEGGGYTICGGRTEIIDQDSMPLGLTVGRTDPVAYRQCWQPPFQLSTVMGRAEVLKRQRFVERSVLAEDWAYMADLLKEGWQIGPCGDEPVSLYRWHRGSYTQTQRRTIYVASIRVLDDLHKGVKDIKVEPKDPEEMVMNRSHLRSARVRRANTAFFWNALVGGDEAFHWEIIDEMNAIELDHQLKIDDTFFETIAVRALVLPYQSAELHHAILARAEYLVEACRALKPTPTNQAYLTALLKFLTRIGQEAAEVGEGRETGAAETEP
ncbi:MAG: glycosyltransferase family 2 protein [Pseudomonadota bacterium]